MPITTHTPYAGCDGVIRLYNPKGHPITIHTPFVGCDMTAVAFDGLEIITTHAPLAECDLVTNTLGGGIIITIHAPLAECGISEQKINYLPIFYYNSRTPCGVRRGFESGSKEIIDYNSRTPCGVRRECAFPKPKTPKLQPTHPLRSATNLGIPLRCGPRNYNPRTLAECDL